MLITILLNTAQTHWRLPGPHGAHGHVCASTLTCVCVCVCEGVCMYICVSVCSHTHTHSSVGFVHHAALMQSDSIPHVQIKCTFSCLCSCSDLPRLHVMFYKQALCRCGAEALLVEEWQSTTSTERQIILSQAQTQHIIGNNEDPTITKCDFSTGFSVELGRKVVYLNLRYGLMVACTLQIHYSVGLNEPKYKRSKSMIGWYSHPPNT